MAGRRQGRSTWVAIFAAYALVLQVVTAGLAGGALAGATPPMLDAFGGVICTADMSGEHGSPTRTPHPHTDPSCLAACALAGQVLIGPPTAPGLAAPSRRTHAVAALPSHDAPTPRRQLGPLGPRGPPLAI
jgi:hypothetical protein